MLSLFRTARAHRGAVRPRLLVILTVLLAAVGPLWLIAQPPAWWATKGVLNTNDADDYAVVNQGQVKHIAKQAYEAMKDASLIDPIADANTSLVQMWQTPAASTDDYVPVNVGQLKFLAVPFYEKLISEGMVSGYPWGASTDDYAWANIGQVKNLFGFSLVAPVEHYYVTIVSGNNQVGHSNQVLSQSLKVRVTNAGGLPLATVQVTFALSAGSGALSSSFAGSYRTVATVVTGVSGEAAVFLKPIGIADALSEVLVTAEGGVAVFRCYVTDGISLVAGVDVAPLAPTGESPIEGGNPTASSFYQATMNPGPPLASADLRIYPFEEEEEVEEWIEYNRRPQTACLQWDAIDGIGSYMVQRRTDLGEWTDLLLTTQTSIEDENLVCGTLYEYRVVQGSGDRKNVLTVSGAYWVPLIKAVTVNYANEDGTSSRTFQIHEHWRDANDWMAGNAYISESYTNHVVDFYPKASSLGEWTWFEGSGNYEEWGPYEKIMVTSNPSPSQSIPPRANFDNAFLDVFEASFGSVVYGGKYIPSFALSGIPSNKFLPANRILVGPGYGNRVALSGSITYAISWVGVGVTARCRSGYYSPNGVYIPTEAPLLNGGVVPTHAEVIFDRVGENLIGDGNITVTVTAADGPLAGNSSVFRLALGSGVTSGVNIPASESSGAKYRKIALNGAPLSDEKPQQESESDQSREETFIDALTLGLRHDTTDTYTPVPSSDFALSVRRSVTSEVWNLKSGLRPDERPDRPFGLGWTTNLAANIHFTTGIGMANTDGSNPDTATVTDENGAEYTFAILYGKDANYQAASGYDGPRTFVPLPSSNHEHSIFLCTLTANTDGTFTFKRKFGSTLKYSMSNLSMAFPADRIKGSSSGSRHTYARLDTVVDRYGNQLDYDYAGGYTVVPKTIKVRRSDGSAGATLSIAQNTKGLVTDIWDPRGFKMHYDYDQPTYTDSVLTDTPEEYGYTVLVEVTAADNNTTGYTHLLSSDADQNANVEARIGNFYHLELGSITDSRNNTYSFEYSFDRSKYDYSSDAPGDGYYKKTGLAKQVTLVRLPGGSTAKLINASQGLKVAHDLDTHIETMVSGFVRRNSVINALGDQRDYDFTNVRVEELPSFATSYKKAVKFDNPRMVYYQTMTITSYENSGASKVALGSESFTFSPDAGMSLTNISDFSGNETTYGFADEFNRSVFEDVGMAAGVFGFYSDPTSQTNALGQTKHFTYGDNRIMTSMIDEAGVKTAWDVDTLGRRKSEQVFFPAHSTTPIKHTVFSYENSAFPNFMTRKTVKHLAGADDELWMKDLVTLYVPDANGRVADEAVDMDGDLQVDSTIDLVTSYTYDDNGNKRTVTDPRGKETTFSYDKRHRLTHVTYHDGHQKRFFYDKRGNKTQEIDENGVATFWRYDSLNRITDQVVDMDGTLKDTYSSTHVLPASLTLNRAKHIVTSYTYNALNAKVTVTDPKGTVTKFRYDALQRLVEKIEDLGPVGPNHFNYITTYSYEEDTELDDNSDQDNDRNVGGSVFDSSSFKPRLIRHARSYRTDADPERDINYRTRITYDDLGRPIKEKVEYAPGLFAVTEKEYDLAGNLTHVTAPAASGQANGTVTKTDYDALRRPCMVTEGYNTDISLATKTLYTSTGLPWKTVADFGAGGLNLEMRNEYDAAGRPVKVFAPAVHDPRLPAGSEPVSPMTETVYDQAGNVTAVINPLLAQTDYHYDDRNRRWKEELPPVADATAPTSSGTPLPRPTRITAYDGVGNVVAVQDARGFVTTSEYDNARRPVIVTAPPMTRVDGTVVYPETRTKYDMAGNIVRLTDANGHVTTNVYDALNRLTSTTQRPDKNSANNITVTNVYDAAGNRTAVIDGKLQRTEFTYDGFNRNTEIKDPALRFVTFHYDAVNKTARIDSENRETRYGYDERHRLTEVVYVDPGDTEPYAADRTYDYDTLSRLETVTEPGKPDVAYTYDALGRQLSETSNGKTHDYVYDLANNRVAVTYGGTDTVLLSTYDTHNRLDTLTEHPASGSPSSGRVTTYGYDLNGNRVFLKLPNGEEVDTQFDPLNRAVAITTTKGTGALLQQLTQAYDPVGNLVQLTERHFGSTLTPRTVGNTYDNVNRLRAETVMQGATITNTAYTFDKANNRTKKIVSVTGGSPSSTTTDYVYNNLNQLQTATEDTLVTSFTYDLNGNRETRTKGGLTDTYAYDYENRLIDLAKNTADGTGTYAYVYDYRTRRVARTENATTTHLVFSGGVSVAEYPATVPTVASVEYIRGSDWGGGVGGLLYSVRSGVPSFKHYNSRGDVISATDETGAATWQATYEAFGTRTQEVGTTQDRQKANTKEEDPTGLLNEGFRYRCLETGVFITRDPLGFVDGPSMYAYVVQNPWSKFDPHGLAEEDANKKKEEDKPKEQPKQQEPPAAVRYPKEVEEKAYQESLAKQNPGGPSARTNSNMTMSPEGQKRLGELEGGFEPDVYKDNAGVPTIGYGHVVLPGEAGKFKNGISQEQGLSLLKNDVSIAETVVANKVEVPLNQNQFDSLVSFTFNTGTGAFKGSTLLKKLNTGDYGSVPSEMKRWNKSTDRKTGKVFVNRGLVNRREHEATWFQEPVSPSTP